VSDFLEEHGDIDPITGNEPERGHRDRRPHHHPQQQQTSAAPAQGSGSAPATTEGTGAANGEQRAGDRGDDRRPRRSRRRRNRGRGFPESKYAQEGAAPPMPAENAPAVSEPESNGDEEVAPIILPGESLAKYRGAPEAAPAESGSETAAR